VVKAVLNRVTVGPDGSGGKGLQERALRIDAFRRRAQFDWRL
jgi:hypothetical protein